MAKKTIEELFSEINELNKEELEILVTALREKLGIEGKIRTANAPVEKGYTDPDPGFEIILVECGRHNVEVIKLIRAYSYRSLADAKACLDHLPIKIINYCPDHEAFTIKKKFEKAGAVVQLERVWN